MTLRNFKFLIVFLFFLLQFSINAHGQYLRNHMISAEATGGFLEQKANCSYQYSFAQLTSSRLKERRNQLFLGLEVGETKLKYSFFGGTSTINKGGFMMQAYGSHLAALFTNVITKPKNGKKGGYKFNYVTFKFAINKFNQVKSRPAYDPYDEDEDFNPPHEEWITNEKCKSLDFELHMAKYIKMNSNHHLRAGIYCGARIGNTSGINHSKVAGSSNGIEYQRNFSYKLNPLILGFSLGYQINFGKQNTI